jgi:hypothetical protein
MHILQAKTTGFVLLFMYYLPPPPKTTSQIFCIKEHFGVHLCNSCSNYPHHLHPTTTKALVLPHRTITIKTSRLLKVPQVIDLSIKPKYQATSQESNPFTGCLYWGFTFKAYDYIGRLILPQRNLAHTGRTRRLVMISNYVFILVKKSLDHAMCCLARDFDTYSRIAAQNENPGELGNFWKQ